jgi:hypothetical protein
MILLKSALLHIPETRLETHFRMRESGFGAANRRQSLIQ